MSAPEALRLADRLDLWGDQGDLLEAAAELRRLHAENEALREANEAFGKRQEWWNDKMVDLEAQRDALLEALKMMRDKYGEYACRACDRADATIKAAEGEA